jgi:FkbM family methyltransferase
MYGIYIGNNRFLIETSLGERLLAPADDLSVSLNLMLTGVHEAPLTKYLLRNVRAGQTVIDVGANIGYFTVLLGILVGPTGQVIAYEPHPLLCSVLLDNLAINYLHDRTEVFQKAVYSEEKELTLHIAKRFAGNSSIHRHGSDYFRHYPDEIMELHVAAEPLSRHLETHPFIDLIKIDIEGGEYHALLGLGPILEKKAVAQVVFELNRSMLRHDWPFLLELLHHYEDRFQLSFHSLSEGGESIPVELDGLLQSGSNPAVVMKPS